MIYPDIGLVCHLPGIDSVSVFLMGGLKVVMGHLQTNTVTIHLCWVNTILFLQNLSRIYFMYLVFAKPAFNAFDSGLHNPTMAPKALS